MNDGITLQQLEAEKKKLEAQLRVVVDYIALKKGESVKSTGSIPSSHNSGSSSVRGRIIDAVVELIHKNGRQVTNKEVLAYVLDEKQLSLGNMKNKNAGLGTILSQECKKKSARIKQVARGFYDLK